MKFSGFPKDVTYTPVPNLLFGPLLEEIEELAELKVTLRGLWLLHQKKGFPRFLSQEDFLNDRALLWGLKCTGKPPQDEIKRGLKLAVARRTFLLYQPDPGVPEKKFYFLNTESDRRALARMQENHRLPCQHTGHEDSLIDQPVEEKPNIFTLYEDNVGMISPILAEELKEAEDLYPWDWISEAFKIAINQNKRSWAYISAILRRWADKGKEHGEPGRYPQKDNREKYVEEYRRRRGRLPWEPADR
jgi:DnaD/phage-associated family protein